MLAFQPIRSTELPPTFNTNDWIWFPKEVEDLELIHSDLYAERRGERRFLEPLDGILVKLSTCDLSEEVICTKFAHDQGLPVPYILHHSPLTTGSLIHRSKDPYVMHHICMNRIPGKMLASVVDGMCSTQLYHIAEQLKDVLKKMRAVQVPGMKCGSVSGGPYRNGCFPFHRIPKKALHSSAEFIDTYRNVLLRIRKKTKFTEDILSGLPRNTSITFAHGDLLPNNIVVHGSTITGILDWKAAGFYPEYWEYCRMHTSPYASTSPKWDYVLSKVFPGPRRNMEIQAFHHLWQVM